jgi:hypothetical protein
MAGELKVTDFRVNRHKNYNTKAGEANSVQSPDRNNGIFNKIMAVCRPQ